MKKIFSLSLSTLLFTQVSFASHPHQAICAVKAKYANQESVQFLLQVESAREYVDGNPNLDIHDYRYQVRVCDDDNDYSQCSTYESKNISHGPNDLVTLVGMKDPTAVFFEGKFSFEGVMEGNIVQMIYQNNTYVKVMVPFKVRLDQCLNQSWVELKPESDSTVY